VDISWKTSEPTYGVVRYGQTIRSYGQSLNEDRGGLPQTAGGGYGTDHKVRINGLQSGSAYYAEIQVIDRADNRASREFDFSVGGQIIPDQHPQLKKGDDAALASNGAKATMSTSSMESDPKAAIDGKMNTAWIYKPDKKAQEEKVFWQVDFDRSYHLSRLQLFMSVSDRNLLFIPLLFTLELRNQGKIVYTYQATAEKLSSLTKRGQHELEFDIPVDVQADSIHIKWELIKAPQEISLFEVKAII